MATHPSGLVRARLPNPTSAPGPAGSAAAGRHPRHSPDTQDGGKDGKVTANEIIGEFNSSRQMPLSFFRSMAGHEDPALRIRATWRWESLTPAQQAGLLDDPDPSVREAEQDRNWELAPERVEAELPSIRPSSRPFVLGRCALSPGSPGIPRRRSARWSPPGPIWDQSW
ncbi:hypothetical protein ABZY45_32535 [Streptomyces sp. NPDC006516]|uniref:hypothetical protein n=1 Tax=Streptomyces sp. NPDC006516 TaxID=3154309 RepID=UPI0033AD84DA